MPPTLVTDRALAQCLERTEAAASAAVVATRATHQPGSGATAREIAGACALFDGVASPLTQAFGVALFTPAAADDLAALEAFFTQRGAETALEVCPLADPALLPLLAERGYRAVEWSTVLVQPLDGLPVAPVRRTTPTVRPIAPSERDAWAAASAEGWGATPDLAAFMRDFGRLTAAAAGMTCFVAEEDETILGTAGLAIHGQVALLTGASTRPAWRRRGAQRALLAARLAHAAAAGCTLAMMGAAPGSTSQANAEREGFRTVYTRTKWVRPLPASG
jgi:GNAT superfamily N-acetyltransferase